MAKHLSVTAAVGERAHFVSEREFHCSHSIRVAADDGACNLKAGKIAGSRGRGVQSLPLQHVGTIHSTGMQGMRRKDVKAKEAMIPGCNLYEEAASGCGWNFPPHKRQGLRGKKSAIGGKHACARGCAEPPDLQAARLQSRPYCGVLW